MAINNSSAILSQPLKRDEVDRIAQMLAAALAFWPDYDFGLNTLTGSGVAGDWRKPGLVRQVLIRIRALIDLIEQQGRDPIHLGEASYRGRNLERIANALAGTPVIELERSRRVLDREMFQILLEKQGFDWLRELAEPESERHDLSVLKSSLERQIDAMAQ